MKRRYGFNVPPLSSDYRLALFWKFIFYAARAKRTRQFWGEFEGLIGCWPHFATNWLHMAIFG